MSFADLLVHEVSIVSPDETTDAYNNVVHDWGPTAGRITSPAWITQLGTAEDSQDRQTPSAQWVAFLPAATAVSFINRLEWNDRVFEVSGLPLEAWSPWAGEHHIEVPLRFAAFAAALPDDIGFALLDEEGEHLLTEGGDLILLEG